MDSFLITFWAVVVLLAYACPGYLLVRSGKLKEDSITVVVTMMLYICQPCLTIHSIQTGTQMIHAGAVSFEDMLTRAGIYFLLTVGAQIAYLMLFFFLFRKKQEEVPYRIFVIASTLGNCGFFGIPMLNAIMPDHPEAAMLSAISSLVLNAICWTIASAIITRDRKYISVKKIFLNPNMAAAAVALPLFFTNTLLPERIGNMVTVLGQFASPLCMLILGMRLATVNLKELFCTPMQYCMVLVKNVGFALFAFAALYFLPVEGFLKQVLFILCACPIASMVLSFSEMLGQGQKTAANVVLLSTLSSVLTMPLCCLLLPYLT